MTENNNKPKQEDVSNLKAWNLRERFQEYPGYKGEHAKVFANRQVEDFDINKGIVDPVNTAYAFRYDEWEDEGKPLLETQLKRLLEDSQVDKVEALIFGMYTDVFQIEQSEYIIQFLVNNKNSLKNLKAVFIGDIHSGEWEISWINQSDVTPILDDYPNLEVLQIRGGEGGVPFTPIQHDKLRSLIIESSGINKNNLQSICNLKLPALEHLELWLGTPNYYGNSSIEDIKPILFDNLFPHLIYLGLRNSVYINEIVSVLIDAPILNSISVLDLSMGNLTDEGAQMLLNCSAISQLKILNISDNYLHDDIIERFQRLDIEEVIATTDQDRLMEYEDDQDYFYRYCSVTE